MSLKTWYKEWCNKRKEEEEQVRNDQAAALDQFMKERGRFISIIKETEKKRIRKAIEEAVTARARFLEVEAFASSIIAVANEEGSYVLDISYRSSSNSGEVSALLKLAVVPKCEG